MKKPASKVAHNQPKPFFWQSSPAQPTAHSSELIFHIIKMPQDASVFLSVIVTQRNQHWEWKSIDNISWWCFPESSWWLVKKHFFRAHLVTSLKALCKRNLIEKGFVANVVINELVQLRCRDYHVINKKGSINIIGLVATDIWTIYYLLNVQPKSLERSPAVRDFYGTGIEFWAGFGPIGTTENKGLGWLWARRMRWG